MKRTLQNGFIDWLTASQLHPKGGLPLVSGGITVHYDSEGNPVFERNRSVQHRGSYQTSIRVACDGFRVSISGNVGRFHRSDNLFGYGIRQTIELANGILHSFGLPPLTTETSVDTDSNKPRPCVVSRLDVTFNYETGSNEAARSVIRFLAKRPIARVRKGVAGSDSFWFANTMHMFKAYLKSVELKAHGADESCPVYQFCKTNGILRFELELKKRLLSKLKMNTLDKLNDEALHQLFQEQTEFARVEDKSSDPEFMEGLPTKTQLYAKLWLTGTDLTEVLSQAQMYRHAKILKPLGVNIFETRNIEKFPIKVRVIDLKPLEVPEWYDELHKDVA